MKPTKSVSCVHAKNGLRVTNDGFVMPCCYYDYKHRFKDRNGDYIKTDVHSIKDMMESPDRRDLINSLENGIKHEGCKRCWVDEDVKGDSKRLRDLETLGMFSKDNNQAKFIELNLGITCNLACRMCNVGASIKWMNEHRLVYDTPDHWKDDDNYKKEVKTFYKSYEYDSIFWEELPKILPDVKTIDMYGGEPMLMKKQWEVLQIAVEKGYSENISLHFNTNGTIYNDAYVEILKNFGHVTFSFSIDGIGKRFEYIRHHGSWDDVDTKVRKWISLTKENKNFEIDLAYTVTNLNIGFIDEVATWCFANNVRMYLINVSEPEYYSPYNLPVGAKNMITEKMNKFISNNRFLSKELINDINGSVNLMNSQNYNLEEWSKFIKATQILDKSRNQDFMKAFPELGKYINTDLFL